MAKKQQQIDDLKQEIAELKERVNVLEFGRWFPLNPALVRDADNKTGVTTPAGVACNESDPSGIFYWPPQKFTGEG